MRGPATPTIAGNTVDGNTATAMGGGLWAFDTRAGLLTLSGNLFYGNSAPDWGGLYFDRTNGAIVDANTVAGADCSPLDAESPLAYNCAGP